MIVRDLKRLALLVGPLLVLLLLSASLWRSHNDYLTSRVSTLLGKNGPAAPSSPPRAHRKPTLTENDTHYEIYSVSTSDGKYFEIRFGKDVFNPNIIPHHKFNDTWHVVGQLYSDAEPSPFANEFHEVGCAAQFIDGALMCINYIGSLPYEPTPGGICEGDLAYFTLNVGPHDARVFYGPENPLTTYGSNSAFTCFGQFVQDFRKLVGWEPEPDTNNHFATGTELQRPPPYSPIEKNFFLFWDKDNQMLMHYNIYPKRGFAKLETDGSTGPDLAPKAAEHDGKCLAKYIPKLPATLESIHQTTNSLKVTMCNRADKDCTPHDGNTFIMVLIQHKTYYDYHSEYEPYVVLFEQRAPYELRSISKKPLWISGRRHHAGRHTDMMYVTSANWKEPGVKYHGFLDDVVMVGFGFEDKSSAAIDVLAGDLLVDQGLCEEP